MEFLGEHVHHQGSDEVISVQQSDNGCVSFHGQLSCHGHESRQQIVFQFYGNSSSKRILTITQPLLISSGTLGGQTLFFQRIFSFDTILVSIFISLLVLNLLRKRTSRSKDLQLLSGLLKFTYLFSHAMCDFILCFMIISLLSVIVKVNMLFSGNKDRSVLSLDRCDGTS